MPQGVYTDGKVKVTVRLEPALILTAKKYALERRTTVQALVTRGLQKILKGSR
jgi:hypothetical protein